MDNLCQRCKAVSCAGRIGYDIHILCICVVVNAHNEHRCICGRCGNDNLFRAAFKMRGCFIHRCKQACGFQNIFRAGFLPGNVLGVHHVVYRYCMPIDYQLAILVFHFTAETAVRGIVFQHIHHIIYVNERIIYRNNLYIAPLQRRSEKQPSNTAKTIDTYFKHEKFLLIVLILCGTLSILAFQKCPIGYSIPQKKISTT